MSTKVINYDLIIHFEDGRQIIIEIEANDDTIGELVRRELDDPHWYSEGPMAHTDCLEAGWNDKMREQYEIWD
tara:strand:+ start:127 stop:345 length:219 start_codon:yes stop_codon:yes gene_type:complete